MNGCARKGLVRERRPAFEGYNLSLVPLTPFSLLPGHQKVRSFPKSDPCTLLLFCVTLGRLRSNRAQTEDMNPGAKGKPALKMS